MTGRWPARWRSSPARRAAPGAASPSRSARRARRCTAPAARTRERRSEYDRPETIEETAELVDAAGGAGHRRRGRPPRARRRSRRSSRASTPSRAGSTCWSTTSGAASCCSSGTRRSGSTTSTTGLRMLRLAIDTHLITSHFALPLLIRRPGGLVVEMTDGTREYNADQLPASRRSTTWPRRRCIRLAFAQGKELAPHGCTAVALTPGWLRSEMMLEHYGVTEENWRDAAAGNPHFAAISESPRFVGRAVAALAADPDVRAPQRRLVLLRRAWRASTASPTSTAPQPDCWRYMVEVQDAGRPAGPDRLPLRCSRIALGHAGGCVGACRQASGASRSRSRGRRAAPPRRSSADHRIDVVVREQRRQARRLDQHVVVHLVVAAPAAVALAREDRHRAAEGVRRPE